MVGSATPICETFKISFLMGRLHAKDVLGNLLKGRIIPFGSLVEYYTISPKDQSRIHQFVKKVLPGLFLGYALYAGGIWKGDTMVADIEELETMDASEIYSKRLHAKEVIFPEENGKFIFPVADGRLKYIGGDQELRTATLIRDHPIRGESPRYFLEESEGSPPPPPQDSLPDAGEAINDFWSMSGNFIYRQHVEPRVKLYSPREESFLIPLKYIDVSRTTHKNLDVVQESRIDDYWNIDGSRDLSDSWTGFTQFTSLKEKTSRRTYMVRGEIDKAAGNIQGRSFVTRNLERHVKGIQAKRDATMGERETEARQCQKAEGYFYSSTQTIQSSKKNQKMRGESWKSRQNLLCLQDGNLETLRLKDNCKSKCACIVEASESTRMRMEGTLTKNHEDHIAGKGENSLQHYNLVHQIYSYASSYENSGSKSSSGQGMGKIGENFGVELDQSQK